MAKSSQAILDSVPKLLKSESAAELVELEDHEDKKVRKAVRRALHQLRSRGVEIPEKGSRSWNPGDSLKELRGDLRDGAVLDSRSMPGGVRIVWSTPDEEEGGTLMVGTMGPDGRVLDFQIYMQTDGQRQRMMKDWDREYGGRRVPPEWAKARLRWSREQTLALGYNVPAKLDEALPRLGEAPAEAPESFLVAELADQKTAEQDDEEVLAAAGCHRWPLLFDADAMFKRLGERANEVEDPAARTEEEKLADITAVAEGDEKLREALRGPIADALADAAVELWLEGHPAQARTVLDRAAELRSTEEAEGLDWVVVLLRFQIAAVAMQQMMQQQGQGHDHHGHDHDHDHDHA